MAQDAVEDLNLEQYFEENKDNNSNTNLIT